MDESGTYLIYDAEDLAAFRDLVNGTNDKAAQPSANAKLMNRPRRRKEGLLDADWL